jgi:hypothetical protein
MNVTWPRKVGERVNNLSADKIKVWSDVLRRDDSSNIRVTSRTRIAKTLFITESKEIAG